MKKPELVFVPSPGIGHLASTVEFVKLLINRHDQLSVTVIVLSSTTELSKTESFIQAASSVSTRIRFVDVRNTKFEYDAENPVSSLNSAIQNSKPHVIELASKLFDSNPDSSRLVGFVLDMFCVDMIDVANELGVPSYIYFTSCAAVLGTAFHLQSAHDRFGVDPTELTDPDAELKIPSLVNPLPAKGLPSVLRTKKAFAGFIGRIRRFRETKGVVANTFAELELHAINSMSNCEQPPIYPVGPVLNLNGDNAGHGDKSMEIMEWLDDQPQESVVFLCFGSLGSFGEEQVREIASALEKSGHRFFWSLRKPPPKGQISPSDYDDPNEVLPEGFLDRTSKVGKVIGWAPQAKILAHKAIGGFVSHCGWNSTLESIWHGVPIAAWPMYAEQQFNAFELVTELGLATEIKIGYRKDGGQIVSAKEIENGIRSLMEDERIRKRMKEMSEKSRTALMEGGSSYSALNRFIADVMKNIPST